MVRHSANGAAGRNGEVLLRAAAEGRAEIVRLSVDQYQAMIRDGIVPEDSTVELLYGMLVRKDRSVLGDDSHGAQSAACRGCRAAHGVDGEDQRAGASF